MDNFPLLSRRQYFRAMLVAGAVAPLASLTGCKTTGQVCPDDPNESAGVDWMPDVLHPMFWGFQELTAGQGGAPGAMRIFYPTYEGTPQNAPILKLCLLRYPVVLFMHGQPPCPDSLYFRRWQLLGMVLARSGYVVVMPKHAAGIPVDGSGDVGVGLAALDFVRNGWEHSNWVDSDVTATAVIGHSFGALLAARVHRARPTIGAYVGFSGAWTEVTDTIELLESLQVPSFFTWATLAGPVSESMDDGGLWNHVPGPKSAAFFPGQHFDYLPPYECHQGGACDLIPIVMAELATLFITRHVPPKTSHAPIPPSLIPPSVTLTPKQEFFAGAHLNGIQLIQSRQGCSIDLRWEDPLDTGHRHLGP